MTLTSEQGSLEVDVQYASRHRPVPNAEKLTRWVGCALAGALPAVLTIRVVDEAEGAELNERFRHGQGATNVLAFPADKALAAALEEPPLLGDIIICAPILEREAAAQGKSLDAHWAHICVHGALHLAGFVHEAAEDATAMEAREVELLASLGFSDPYEGGR